MLREFTIHSPASLLFAAAHPKILPQERHEFKWSRPRPGPGSVHGGVFFGRGFFQRCIFSVKFSFLFFSRIARSFSSRARSACSTLPLFQGQLLAASVRCSRADF